MLKMRFPLSFWYFYQKTGAVYLLFSIFQVFFLFYFGVYDFKMSATDIITAFSLARIQTFVKYSDSYFNMQQNV